VRTDDRTIRSQEDRVHPSRYGSTKYFQLHCISSSKEGACHVLVASTESTSMTRFRDEYSTTL
jgi:hypothetical protein